MCRLCLEVSVSSVGLDAVLADEAKVGQFVRSPEMRAELLRTLKRMLRISKFPANGLVAELNKVWQV